jgi:hypothetical protein
MKGQHTFGLIYNPGATRSDPRRYYADREISRPPLLHTLPQTQPAGSQAGSQPDRHTHTRPSPATTSSFKSKIQTGIPRQGARCSADVSFHIFLEMPSCNYFDRLVYYARNNNMTHGHILSLLFGYASVAALQVPNLQLSRCQVWALWLRRHVCKDHV